MLVPRNSEHPALTTIQRDPDRQTFKTSVPIYQPAAICYLYYNREDCIAQDLADCRPLVRRNRTIAEARCDACGTSMGNFRGRYAPIRLLTVQASNPTICGVVSAGAQKHSRTEPRGAGRDIGARVPFIERDHLTSMRSVRREGRRNRQGR